MSEYIEMFCDEYGYFYYSDYSGRGMYGKQCSGIVCSDICQVLVELCSYLTKNGVENYEKMLVPICYDNMGKDMIV